MSPIPHIGEYKEKKNKSYFSWYLLAGIIGVAIFFFFLISFKVIVVVVGFAIKHWIYFAIGVLVLLILIRKLRKSKRKKGFKRHEDLYR